MKSFELKIEVRDDQVYFDCKNDGLNVYELLGFLDIERQSLLEQVRHPENFDMTCIKPDGTIMKIDDKERQDAK